MKHVTPRQRDVLRFIAAFIDEHGYAPVFREIGAALGVTFNCVHDHLSALERKGCVTREKRLSRTITITPLGLEQL